MTGCGTLRKPVRVNGVSAVPRKLTSKPVIPAQAGIQNHRSDWIGTDEAGSGPNLGPLVITATAWSVPGGPKQFDFWSALSSVVSQQPDAGRLHVADSKQVYSPSKGLANLERSVLALLALRNWQPESLSELIRGLTDARSISEPLRLLNCEPWFEDADLELPFVVSPSDYQESAEKLRETCEADRIAFRSLATDVIFTERFNQLCERHGNKGAALSKSTLTLIRSQWDPDSGESTLIIGDKHGGRNRYDDLIDEQLDGQMIFRVTEGRDRSIYRVAGTELHFRQGAESHFPVTASGSSTFRTSNRPKATRRMPGDFGMRSTTCDSNWAFAKKCSGAAVEISSGSETPFPPARRERRTELSQQCI